MATNEEKAQQASKRAHAAAQEVGPPSTEMVLGVLDKLRGEVKTLNKSINGDPETGEKGLKQRVNVSSRTAIIAVVGLILDTSLTLGFGYLYHRVDTNSSAATVACRAQHELYNIFKPFVQNPVDNPATPQNEVEATKKFIALVTRPCPVPKPTPVRQMVLAFILIPLIAYGVWRFWRWYRNRKARN